MTKHQYLHLTNEIAKLHSAMTVDFILVVAMIVFAGLIGIASHD